jgi:hypothetical protein
MQKNTLQILRYLAMPCLFSSVGLIADGQENEKMTFCQTYDMVKGKVVTPYAGPVVDGGVDVYVNASYILWHANEGGLQYAYSGVASASSIQNGPTIYEQPEGRLIAPSFKTNSGFKAGLGLDFSYDGWDLGLNYTWLQAHSKSRVSANDVSGMLMPVHTEVFDIIVSSIPTYTLEQAVSGSTNAITQGFESLSLNEAASSWRLHFNVLDLELGRNFFISSKLLIRPHYGFKGSWQKQNNLTTYDLQSPFTILNSSTYRAQEADGIVVITNADPSFSVALIPATTTVYTNSYQSYWGFGPRAGMNLSWLTTRNFSVFTDVSVSALWGQFKSNRRDTVSVEIDPYLVPLVDVTFESSSPYAIRSRTHQVNVVLESQMGLRYDYWFSNDEYRFRAEAGWENQVWFSQNQLLYHVNDNSSGDLTLQGFTLTFQFDF